MTPEDIFAKTLKVYSSCSSYKDFGKIEIFGPASGAIFFETIFLHPDKLIVKIIYGNLTEPIQTEIFWINGNAAFFYSIGATNSCERKPVEEARLLGLLSECDFLVPHILLEQKFGLTSRNFPPLQSFQNSESGGAIELVGMLSCNSGTLTITMNEDFHLQKVHRRKRIQTIHPDFQLFLSTSKTLPGVQNSNYLEKIHLLFGEHGVLKIPDLEIVCTYKEISFDCEIPNSLFDFNAKEIK
jgi:hypothetical protein